MTGCASKPENVAAVPYPDSSYSALSCAEIRTERQRIEQEVLASADELRSARKKDQAKLVLLPASLLIKDGDDEKAERLGRLKGQFESLERVSTLKDCGPG